MPFLHKFTSPLFRSSSSQSRDSRSTPSCSNLKDVAYSPVSQSDQFQVQVQTQVQAKTQTHKTPAQQQPDSYFAKASPAFTVQEPESQSQAQFIYEDINPPAGLEHLVSTQTRSQSLSTSQSAISLHSQTTSQSQPPTMISQTTSTSPSSPPLPLYNDVSGSVVVDTEGYPRFLTPDEQQERESTLQKAVHERMMGLPRRTEFTWEVQGGPVLPRYEPTPPVGQPAAEVGNFEGGEKR